jgi:hypothetical protein
MMEAVSDSETSVSFYETTWCNIPEDLVFILLPSYLLLGRFMPYLVVG